MADVEFPAVVEKGSVEVGLDNVGERLTVLMFGLS